jgi:glycolate oxidase
MAFQRNIYKALEDVVGPEYISEDPVILDSYAWRSGMATLHDRFVPRYEAVTLPKDTGEVQAIVKLCNKLKIQFTASSTGWGSYCDPAGPGVVKMDLRRMNRVIEINEKNMYAVVEPYVIFAELQAEVMKRGFNCNITGAGSNCSALPIAAHQGLGHMSQSLSYGERNLLAVEWVTPEGELVRLGSLGSLGEWFCGDGPGPSLRGIIRGNVTPLGGLGVFTKAAQKLYHWPGPSAFPLEGVSPDYVPTEIPPGFMYRYISWLSLEKLTEAVYKIGMSEIAFEIMGFNPGMIASNIATSNVEDRKLLEEFTKQVQGPGSVVIIAANSARDYEYKTRVLQQIMEETGGKSLEPVEKNYRYNSGALWRCIRITASIRETCRSTGCFAGEVGGTDVFTLMATYINRSQPIKKDFIKRGLVRNDGLIPFVQSVEHGHQGHAEVLNRYFQTKETADGVMEFMGAANEAAIKDHFGVPAHAWSDRSHDAFGPHACNYHLWLRAIKKTFDPNASSEPSHYISVKE